MFKAINLITKPFFSTCDYIRRLLRQHADELKSIGSIGVSGRWNGEEQIARMLTDKQKLSSDAQPQPNSPD